MAQTTKTPYILVSESNVTSTHHSPKKDYDRSVQDKSLLAHEMHAFTDQSSSDDIQSQKYSRRSESS